LATSGGRPAKWQKGQFDARWWLERPPPTRPSPPRVDAWQPRHGLNHLKSWSEGQGFGPVDEPLGPLGVGSGPLGPRVKYTPVVIMILTFG
jgi:hypothetical protein